MPVERLAGDLAIQAKSILMAFAGDQEYYGELTSKFDQRFGSRVNVSLALST